MGWSAMCTSTHQLVLVLVFTLAWLPALCPSGKARLASGFVVLAMQGIQHREIQAFGLATEDDKLLRNLAGNAFTANIIAAFLLAGMLVM